MRELLQNAIDAVRARRHLQSNSNLGQIDVELFLRGDDFWLSVEDDGVGMSEHVLTHNLVDFGSSLWRSTTVTEEFPGLAAKGMSAIGRFGIGFFSVFMIAEEVRVITRRFDHAASDALQLLFNNGVDSRPVVAPARPETAPRNGGTRVELKLHGRPRNGDRFQFVVPRDKSPEPDPYESAFRVSLSSADLCELVKQLAPCADVLIRVTEERTTAVAVTPEDWISCAPHELLGRLISSKPKLLSGYLHQLMRPIISEDGKTIGRAAIWPSLSAGSQTGVLVAEGFRVQAIPHLAGVLVGKVDTAVRNSGSAIADEAAFKEWATEQTPLISKTAIPDETKALMAEIILELGGSIGDLPIIRRGDVWYSGKKMKTALRSINQCTVYVGDVDYDEDDDVSASSFHHWFELSSDIFVIPKLSSTFTSRSQKSRRRSDRPSHLLREFDRLLQQVWKKDWEELDESVVIGEVNGTDIYRTATIYKRS
ncbi:ATP-binding protein [Neorhizobium alkalisoli]|uniref:ATP-binding protein n=1 Tax=Neorhizobium alkalisoli TaxID=528178 RepID=UPI001319EA15|nr:ATP-binding protein [Neorhizobium alkalisoli]